MLLFIIGGFVRKLKANTHPVAGVKIAPTECCVKEWPEIIIWTDSVQKPVEILDDSQNFIERGNGLTRRSGGRRGYGIQPKGWGMLITLA
jgi:hypothetical protein